MPEDFKSLYFPETQFGGYSRIDGTMAFYTRVRALIPLQGVVLDAGCGRGIEDLQEAATVRALRRFKPPAREVIGIDIDPEAAHNPRIDRFVGLSPETKGWPIADGSVDLIMGDWVLEHVQDPAEFFAECRRVLTPGGFLCLRTTNRLGYVGMISSLIPNHLHTRIANRAREIREGQDTYPTCYRCNTPGKLKRAFGREGFRFCVYEEEAEPSYLRFSRGLYSVGRLYRKLAPNMFYNTLYGFAQKPGS